MSASSVVVLDSARVLRCFFSPSQKEIRCRCSYRQAGGMVVSGSCVRGGGREEDGNLTLFHEKKKEEAIEN